MGESKHPAYLLMPMNLILSTRLNGYGSETLTRLYRDMVYIREFETMLDLFKREGKYRGISYTHRGPAHLSIGQEAAAAVGQSLHLGPEDYIFGSHRSHGEILAKSFSAIEQLGDVELEQIMTGYMDGVTLKVAETFGYTSVKELAVDYVL